MRGRLNENMFLKCTTCNDKIKYLVSGISFVLNMKNYVKMSSGKKRLRPFKVKL